MVHVVFFTNGFTCKYSICNFELVVSCSLVPDTLTHVGHKHPLILYSTTLAELCSVCNYKMKMFRCTECDFTLDFGCATLPTTIKYRQHEHLFTLRCTIEDDSGECYCDKCSYSAHPRCVFGKFLNSKYQDCRNIKFGSTYTSNIQEYPLTLARKTMDHASCDKCGKFCNEVAYECATCNSNIQVQGLPNCKSSLMDFVWNKIKGFLVIKIKNK